MKKFIIIIILLAVGLVLYFMQQAKGEYKGKEGVIGEDKGKKEKIWENKGKEGIIGENKGKEESNIVNFYGTIKRYSDRGGFYGIAGDDGKSYKPINLSQAYKIEGLKVKVKGRMVKKGLLFSPPCKSMEIIEIQRAKRGDVAGSKVFSDPGQTISVRPDETFVIELEANHTTGYIWQLVTPVNKNIVESVDLYYITRQDTGLVLMGEAGKERWIFKAVGPGEAEIKLKYMQPWEKDKAPAREETFRVRVGRARKDSSNL